MKRDFRLMSILILLVLSVSLNGFSKGHSSDRPSKKGILLVAFGSSYPEAQVAFVNIEKKVTEAFPETPIKWAYTSTKIRKKLAKQGKVLDSPEVALAKMMEEGFTHVAVQSLHTITGIEFHELQRNSKLFEEMIGGFTSIRVGLPLLASPEDMEKTTQAILSMIPEKRKKKEAVILMGHGTHHGSNAYYTALMYRLQQIDPLVFVGTVEGAFGIDAIKGTLKKNKVKKAYLIPFMSVAGDHARNDMAGDEDDSWKSVLEKEKIACESILKGTAEVDDFVAIWLEHLKIAFARL